MSTDKSITYSEKNTDYEFHELSTDNVGFEMQTAYTNRFGYNYSTGLNKHLFGNNYPDGYDLMNDISTIVIIENKKSYAKFNAAIKQVLSKYVTNAVTTIYKHVYVIIGTGYGKDFACIIYKYTDNKLTNTEMDMDEFVKNVNSGRDKNMLNVNVHSVNEYMRNNDINIPKAQRTIFLSFMLIILKIDPFFMIHYHGVPSDILIDKMLTLIDNKYCDKMFMNQFAFISSSIHNKHISKMMQMLTMYMKHNKQSNADVLNMFYNEFCIYDKAGDSEYGIVLTPDDIVELMISLLEIKNSDRVLDTCTGTGSFLIKSSQYTSNLVGCENNEERYTLAKCNFILHDLDYKHLYHSSCFDVEFPMCDKLVINPPFIKTCSDTELSQFIKEQQFVLHAIKYLKPGGRGAVIIPITNFNECSDKFKNELLKYITPICSYKCNSQVFSPSANVQCVVLVFEKTVSTSFSLRRINYINDGYKVSKKTRIKKSDPDDSEYDVITDIHKHWAYMKTITEYVVSENDIIAYNIDYIYYEHKIQLHNGIDTIVYNHFAYPISINMCSLPVTKFRVRNVLVKIKNKPVIISNTKPGIYPLISSKTCDRGVCAYIDTYDINTSDYNNVISVSWNGTVGNCFVHDGYISTTSDTWLFNIINENINAHIFAIVLSNTLNGVYDWSNKMKIDNLLDIELSIPC